jgi:Zn-dependent M28 family amino/carboxypeptidase
LKKAVLFIYTACLFFQLPAQPLANGELFVKKTAAKHYITALAHDSMRGRATGISGMYKAAEFIAAEMKAAGLKPLAGNNDFFQYYKLVTKKKSFIAVKVIGAVEGKSLKDEVVIFCAHYDHLGVGFNRRGDSIFNGANDNASGVAAVLLLAEQVKKLQPERTVLFIAFSGEKIGLRGSEEFVASIKNPELIKAVINFDMIGRGKYAYIIGYEYGNLPRLLNRELLDYDQVNMAGVILKKHQVTD